MEEVRLLSVLIDVNVLLDVILAREPWLFDARDVWAGHNRRAIVGHVAAHGLTNLFYIARRIVGIEKAREAVKICLKTFEILGLSRHPRPSRSGIADFPSISLATLRGSS